MDHFNLVDQPWVPVRLVSGQVLNLGLLDVFRRQSEIAALACSRPPAMVSITRLLLVITHRALTLSRQRWAVRDRFNWYQNGLPVDEIAAYLDRWHAKFNLFDPEFPFMQAAVLGVADETRDKVKPWTQIDLASASGNTPIVFDHACDLDPVAIEPAHAASLLLEYQSFVPGGLVKVFRASDKAGPLANTAAVIPVGATLWQTLCLCLHPSAVDAAVEDLPCWEQAVPTVKALSGAPTLATGPNDRYTRLARSVLLLREADGSVRWLRFGAGLALDEDVQAPDPMAAYRPGSQGLVRLTFTEGRALWRDLPALLPAVDVAGGKAPSVLEYAAVMHAQALARSPYQPVWVAGLASDQAKLLRWRLEQVLLPEKLLLNKEDIQDFRELVQVADALYGALRSVAMRVIAASMPGKESRERQRFDAEQYAASYFSMVERSLPGVLRRLQADEWAEARADWGCALQKAGVQMWDVLQKNRGFSPVASRAQAQQARYFFGAIKHHLTGFVPVDQNADQKEGAHE